MNSSLALLQKIKTIAAAGTSISTDYVINFPLFAFPLNEDDFVFLKDIDNSSGEDTKKYYSSEYNFAQIANSIPSNPITWTLDPENLLYDKYKNVLIDASLIDPGELSAEEQSSIDNASSLLYTKGGKKTTTYSEYDKYYDKDDSIHQKIWDIKIKLNNLGNTDSDEYKHLSDEMDSLQKELDENSLKWISIGHKLEVEKAKNTINSLKLKNDFVTKWRDERNSMTNQVINIPELENSDFFETSCSPNDFFIPDSGSWQRIEIKKEEISKLISQYQKEIPDNITEQFGDIDVDLESIEFKFCMLSIIRNWFDPDLLNSNLWKFRNDSDVLSLGGNEYKGRIPCYPVYIFIIKDVSFKLSEDKTNDNLQTQIESGKPLIFGNLLLKVPANMNTRLKSITPQTLSNTQLKNIASVRIKSKTQPNVFTKFTAYNVINRKGIKAIAPEIQKKGLIAHKVSNLRLSMAGRFNMKFKSPTDTNFILSGKITDTSNKIVSSVEITVQRISDGSLQTVLSDDQGNYKIQNLIKGDYHIKYWKENYKSMEIDVNLNSNLNKNISLENEPTKEEYFLVAIISKKMPKLPDPVPGGKYI